MMYEIVGVIVFLIALLVIFIISLTCFIGGCIDVFSAFDVGDIVVMLMGLIGMLVVIGILLFVFNI